MLRKPDFLSTVFHLQNLSYMSGTSSWRDHQNTAILCASLKLVNNYQFCFCFSLSHIYFLPECFRTHTILDKIYQSIATSGYISSIKWTKQSWIFAENSSLPGHSSILFLSETCRFKLQRKLEPSCIYQTILLIWKSFLHVQWSQWMWSV